MLVKYASWDLPIRRSTQGAMETGRESKESKGRYESLFYQEGNQAQ